LNHVILAYNLSINLFDKGVKKLLMLVPKYAVLYLKKGEFCMNQCLRIMFEVPSEKKKTIRSLIQEEAKKLILEGTVRIMPGSNLKVIACGNKHKMDMFLDVVLKEVSKAQCDGLEIEPFLKDRDYRGVFRVIE
jgi:acylphosphatase